MITPDMAHVLLDALDSHDIALNGGERPWNAYETGDDPKSTEVGYINLTVAARAALEAILG